jgi:hypothetical protein
MKKFMVFMLIGLLSSVVLAVDYSGTWVLNSEKSELGDGPGARMAVKKMVVEQKKETIKIESTRTGRDGGDRTNTQEMTLDGKDCKQESQWGEAVSNATLSEDVLVIKTKRTFERDGQSNEMQFEQKWSMDGTILVVNATSDSPWGENKMKLVYEKQ